MQEEKGIPYRNSHFVLMGRKRLIGDFIGDLFNI